MRGECSGKVRSTPTPYEMRRTVNDARPPSPRRRITMPSKSCVRSFSPSMTLTYTRTVSPGMNPARSFLICAASTNPIRSMTAVPFSCCLLFLELLRRLAALEPLHQLPLLGRQARRRQQVRALAPREPDGLHPTPARDARVIAREQHCRHADVPILLASRVLRRLQQPVRERLALAG